MYDTDINPKKIKISDGKLVLRPYCSRDIPELYKAIRESLVELSPWLPFAHKDYSEKETHDWIKRRPKDWKKGISYEFSILDTESGMIIGGCGLNGVDSINRRANLGYWVRTSHLGQGVASNATRLLAKWGFETLKLKRIEILVDTRNQRSLRVAERVGAKKEGILRNRLTLYDNAYDAVMHSLIPGDI